MASEQLRAAHPRRAGIGDALARAFPLTDATEERQIVHRLELKQRVRR